MDPKKKMETVVKVGPRLFIGLGAPWDDKGQSMLTHIFISYDSKRICSIQTAYFLDGKVQLSDRHGGDGFLFKTVEIDYPTEFLTGISGYGDIESGDCMVKSLTFETNRGKFGPFGTEKGTHFCIQMGTKQQLFAGFHGTSNAMYLYSIGVYVKAINPLEHSELHTSTASTIVKKEQLSTRGSL